jgi:multidrug efflux system outer membrane protein
MTQADLPATPAVFREADARWTSVAPADTLPRGEWWKVFADPVLDNLIERGTGGKAGNTSIQQAAARLSQARAQARAAGAARMPQAGINAGVSRQGGPLINAAGADGTLLTASGTLSYEVDLVGKLSRAAEAATLDAQSRESLLQSARLVAQADIAQTYFSLRSLDAERALVRAMAATQRDSLKLVERRRSAGLITEMELARARAELETVEAEAISLERRRAELEHALAFMAGDIPAAFRIEEGAFSAALPHIPPGIPSTVLARRPDVSAAQRSVLAAQTRLGAAHVAWFPNLSLTGAAGYASPELSDLFTLSARAWSIGALLAMPIFDGGRREAGIQSAGADLELANAGYREQVLVAFRDVEDQLSALRLLAGQSDALSRAAASASHAATLSESLHRNGLVSQLDLLDARRADLRARRTALGVQSQRYLATVGLVRALGGGWAPAAIVGQPAPESETALRTARR